MKHGWLAWMVVVALALALAGGCSDEDSSGRKKITLQLNWKAEPQFGGFFAAKELGIFEKHGLNVDVKVGGASAPTPEMVGAGTVEFAIVSGDQLVKARAAGNRIVALFAAYQTCPQGLMTRASRGFNEIGDIFKNEGTVAMESGLTYSGILEKQYGFDKVRVVPVPYGDLTLFLSDPDYTMQCFVTSEPIAARKAGVEPKVFLLADAGYNPYTTVLATSEEYLAKNPEIVRAMVKAVREGWEAYLKDPAKTNEAMQQLNPEMDAATFAESARVQIPLIETDETRSAGLGTMTRERWQALIDQMREFGAISGPVKADECFRIVE
jgi:NitT/TauT family transport system substrate-binding protein